MISSNRTFGTLRQNLYQDDYLTRKKGLNIICNKLKNKISSYNELNSYNWGKYTKTLNNYPILPVNKNNLIIGQYSTTNLNNSCQIIPSNANTCSPINITYNNLNPFYYSYTIDPYITYCSKPKNQFTTFTPPNNFITYNKII